MNAVLPGQHEHVWGSSGACAHCAARKCKRWQCALPCVTGARVCQKHFNGRTEVVPQARPVRVLTYVHLAARHLTITEATQ